MAQIKVRHNGVLLGKYYKKGNKMYGRELALAIYVFHLVLIVQIPNLLQLLGRPLPIWLSETVSFTAVASGADNYTIGIDKTSVGRVVTEGCGSTYTISADRLGAGDYSAYMTVANSAGYVDTYRVYFSCS